MIIVMRNNDYKFSQIFTNVEFRKTRTRKLDVDVMFLVAVEEKIVNI